MNFIRILRLEAARLTFRKPGQINRPAVTTIEVNNGHKQQERQYKNFGHKRPDPPTTFSYIYCTVLSVVLIGAVFNWEW